MSKIRRAASNRLVSSAPSRAMPSSSIQQGNSALDRHQQVGENNILFSSRDEQTKMESHPFVIPLNHWAMIHWVNFVAEEAYVVELVFDPGWCCNEPGGCAPYLIGCGCQPRLSICDGPNPLVITHPGKYRLKRVSGTRGNSTVMYTLLAANSVPHEMALGFCSTTGGNCATC